MLLIIIMKLRVWIKQFDSNSLILRVSSVLLIFSHYASEWEKLSVISASWTAIGRGRSHDLMLIYQRQQIYQHQTTTKWSSSTNRILPYGHNNVLVWLKLEKNWRLASFLKFGVRTNSNQTVLIHMCNAHKFFVSIFRLSTD